LPYRIIATFTVFNDPSDYANQQHPFALSIPLSSGSLIITYQLGNVFSLLAGLAIVCCFVGDSAVARGYLMVVAIADLGHIYSSYLGMGEKYFLDLTSWNQMAWANIGVSAFLCLNRVATVSGVFGRIGGRAIAKKTN
jgi:hypothetical protein